MRAYIDGIHAGRQPLSVPCRTCGERIAGLLEYENHARGHAVRILERTPDGFAAIIGGPNP